MSTNRTIGRSALIITLGIMVIIAIAVWRLPQGEGALSTQELRDYGVILLPQQRQVREFELTDHHNQPFTLASLEGQWTLVFFGFTHCPDVCPIALEELSRNWEQIQTSLPPSQQLKAVMVSVDPQRDTPEHLALYIPSFDPSFTGVTGDIGSIYQLSIDLMSPFMPIAAEQAVGNYNIEHAAHYAIVNPCGHYAGFLRNPVDPRLLPHAMASLVRQQTACL